MVYTLNMARAKEFNPQKALEQALHTFWRHGYEATSMQMLVKATGLSRSSLYDTFGDKRQLYLASLNQYRQQTESEFEQERSFSPLTTIKNRFQAIINSASLTAPNNGCFVVNTAVELCQHDAQLCHSVQESLASSEDWFFEMLELSKDAGELASDLDSRAVARFLLSGSCGLQVLIKAKQKPQMLKDAVDTMLQVLR